MTPQEVNIILKQINTYSGIIYCYTNKQNGKKYIGQTIRPLARHKQHCNNSTKERAVWNKVLERYGIENFTYEVLAICCAESKDKVHEKLNARERFYINLFRSTIQENGYNIAKGGWYEPTKNKQNKPVDMFDLNGVFLKSFDCIEDAKKYIGISGPVIRKVCNGKGRSCSGYLWAWRGKLPTIKDVYSVHQYDINGKYVSSYKTSKEAAIKLKMPSSSGISKAMKEKYRIANGYYWRDYRCGAIDLNELPGRVYQYTSDGDFIKAFKSKQEAAESLIKCETSNICQAIKRNTMCKGYLWRDTYSPKIKPNENRYINKAPVIAIFDDGSKIRYETIKEAVIKNGCTTGSVNNSIRKGNRTKQNIIFKRC
jgi:hypothetical protein